MTGMLIWDNSPLPKATMCELLIPVQRLELGIMWIRRKQGNQNAFEHTGECARCKLSIKGKIWEEAGTSAPNSLLLIETPWANFEQVHQGKEIPTSYNSPVNANWRGDLGYENQKNLCNILDYIDISWNTSELRTCTQRLCHQSSFAHTPDCLNCNFLWKEIYWEEPANSAPHSLLQNWNTLRFCLAQDGASGQRREIPILKGRCGVLHKLGMLKARNRVTSAIKHTTSRNTWEHA